MFKKHDKTKVAQNNVLTIIQYNTNNFVVDGHDKFLGSATKPQLSDIS